MKNIVYGMCILMLFLVFGLQSAESDSLRVSIQDTILTGDYYWNFNSAKYNADGRIGLAYFNRSQYRDTVYYMDDVAASQSEIAYIHEHPDAYNYPRYRLRSLYVMDRPTQAVHLAIASGSREVSTGSYNSYGPYHASCASRVNGSWYNAYRVLEDSTIHASEYPTCYINDPQIWADDSLRLMIANDYAWFTDRFNIVITEQYKDQPWQTSRSIYTAISSTDHHSVKGASVAGDNNGYYAVWFDRKEGQVITAKRGDGSWSQQTTLFTSEYKGDPVPDSNNGVLFEYKTEPVSINGVLHFLMFRFETAVRPDDRYLMEIYDIKIDDGNVQLANHAIIDTDNDDYIKAYPVKFVYSEETLKLYLRLTRDNNDPLFYIVGENNGDWNAFTKLLFDAHRVTSLTTSVYDDAILIYSGRDALDQQHTWIGSTESITDISEAAETAPLVNRTFTLVKTYPNPFNPVVNITFNLAENQPVNITVFDIHGRTIANLIDETLPAGRHRCQWKAVGQASGAYFVVLKSASEHVVKKILLMK